MDSKLAEMYKTEEALQNEAEALATLGMAEKLASAEDLDVDGMSDEEAESLAASILDGDEGQSNESPDGDGDGQDDSQGGDDNSEKTASEIDKEKVAEAEHLGRVMAHAFVNERSKIAQAAAAEKSKTAGKKDKAGKVMGALKKKASAEAPAAEPEQKEEEVSALDRLALARAQEILKENGIEAETEKKSSIPAEKVEQLQSKVEGRAQELLREAGYKFEGDESGDQ